RERDTEVDREIDGRHRRVDDGERGRDPRVAHRRHNDLIDGFWLAETHPASGLRRRRLATWRCPEREAVVPIAGERHRGTVAGGQSYRVGTGNVRRRIVLPPRAWPRRRERGQRGERGLAELVEPRRARHQRAADPNQLGRYSRRALDRGTRVVHRQRSRW